MALDHAAVTHIDYAQERPNRISVLDFVHRSLFLHKEDAAYTVAKAWDAGRFSIGSTAVGAQSLGLNFCKLPKFPARQAIHKFTPCFVIFF